MPFRLRVLAATIFYLSVTASMARAQTVNGTVVLPDSVTPIVGAIVVATDARGVRTQVLTTSRGRFVLRVPHAGRYEFRVLRIGFRPTIVPAVDIASDISTTLKIVATSERVSLVTITVRGATDCRIRPDTGLLIAKVWEEARKAMLSSQLQSSETALVGEWIEYDRTLDSTVRIIRQQNVQYVRHPTTHVFKSMSADSLAEYGYVVNDATGVAYYAPDAAALLSDRFTSTHCFRLVEGPKGDASVIGVQFQPTRRRRGVHDIDGVFWVDRATAELRSIEFQYTNFPDISEAAVAGGRVEFTALKNGNWIVTSWQARLPIFEQHSRTGGVLALKTEVATATTVVRSLHITGGEVGRVLQGDSVLLEREVAAARIQLIARDPAILLAGASVALRGTNFIGTTDASGFLRIGPLPAGTYLASVIVPQLDSLGVPPIEREVEARLGVRTDSLVLPSAAEVFIKLCPGVSDPTGLLRGTVRNMQGNIVPGAAVTVTYMRVDARGKNEGRFKLNTTVAGAITDVRGRWQFCGIPHESDLKLDVESDSGSDHRALRLSSALHFGTVDLVLHPDSISAADRASRQNTLVEFIVSTPDGETVTGVTLEVAGPNGVSRTTTTGVTGRALIPDVAAGVLTVTVKKIGFRPGTLAFAVLNGRNTAPITLSPITAPQLDTVRIVGGRRGTGRLDGFETRRVNHEATRSITREDIEKRHPVDAWQLLTDVPSVRLVPSAQGLYATSGRGNEAHGAACPLQVMVDGVLLAPRDKSNGVDLNELPRPESIHGIEVFAGDARVPVQYGGLGSGKSCGLIAIWTRER